MALPLPTLETAGIVFARHDRVMALDLGTKTIGLAVSDAGRQWASGLKTLKRGKFTANAAEILKIAAYYSVAAIVLGLPLNMDGSMGPRAQATRAFARHLAGLTAIPVVFEDERLSTEAAHETLQAAGIAGRHRRELIDAAAAEVILQTALDRLKDQQGT
ncbi:MAG: Holliday junction resolvase RuvX [Methylobacterium sp.]|nr:Holliday junction resolvase RuvX [Methylobacterium sp.]